MKNLLVLGGSGFIGSNFIRYILEKEPTVYVTNYDSLTYAGNTANLSDITTSKYAFVKGDICDKELLLSVIKDNKIDHIINFAAETHVDHSIFGGAEEFVQTNVVGVMTICNIIRDWGKELGIKKFIHVSTDEVYGSLGPDDPHFTEITRFSPSTPYAASKAAGDLLCESYFKTHGIPVIVTHSSNNYGKYQYPEKLIPLCIKRLNEGKTMLVHGYGNQIRDWIHVEDHCSALHLLLKKGVVGEVYNIGANNEKANGYIMWIILEELGLTLDRLEFVPDRPANDKRYAINAKKIKSLGWKPKYTGKNFEQSLRETIQEYNALFN